MSKSTGDNTKKRPPETGTLVGVRFQSNPLAEIDAWRSALSRRDREGGFPLHYDRRRNRDGSEFLIYSAESRRLISQPGFMVDCSDDTFSGSVLMRHYRRPRADAARFSRRAA